MNAPPIGTIIDRYRVEGAIGAGAMADVIAGVDIALHRRVAIKILSEQHRGDRELEARFEREGRAVASISHTNVVQVFTTGTYEGRPYIAMEYLTGCDLGTAVEQRGPMSSLAAARAILDCARGLEAAANVGLIHRDVKPANLMMLNNGTVKVTDFGLVKPAIQSADSPLTALGTVVGTPDYIAPEQARGHEIDERVDLYALGGTLFFLLVGTPPFRTGNPAEDTYVHVVARHLNTPAPDPRAYDTNADCQLVSIQRQLMCKTPRERIGYQELIVRLSSIINRLSNQPRHSAITASASNSTVATHTPKCNVRIRRTPADSNFDIATTPGESDHWEQAESTFDDIPGLRHTRRVRMWTWLPMIVCATCALLYFWGPVLTEPRSVPSTPNSSASSAGTPTQSPNTQQSRQYTAPAGMFLVSATDTHRAFFMHKIPVRYADYLRMFPNHKAPRRNVRSRNQAMKNITPLDAMRYARTLGGRLPTVTEWQRARTHQSFESQPTLWEWLDIDMTQTAPDSALCGNRSGQITTRKPRQYNDIGFRLVIDAEVSQ